LYNWLAPKTVSVEQELKVQASTQAPPFKNFFFERVLLHPIRVLSHLMSACKHCNVKLYLYYWTHWSCW